MAAAIRRPVATAGPARPRRTPVGSPHSSSCPTPAVSTRSLPTWIACSPNIRPIELRFGAELTKALKALGLIAPYELGGLMGIANDPELVVAKVIHQTDVAMDENGTEAAAATVVLAVAGSAPINPPVPVVLDRPFIYRIVDDQSSATLFIGQVLNPLG
ncbi:MAG: serpin family protein [Ilumatobacteraceae bacterium]